MHKTKVTTAGVSLAKDSQKTFTIEEVKKHNGSDGTYWTAINNKVYDISSFIDEHPGGAVVALCAGRDGDDLLESYHPSGAQIKALAMLDRFYIGELATPVPTTDNAFFVAVRSRVEQRLREVGWGRHFFESVALFEVFATIALYLFASHRVATAGSWFWVFAVGVLTARLGFIMHMGNHRAVSKHAARNTLIEKTMDFIGGSSHIWSYEHAVAHHLTPNVLWSDNDCSIANPWLRFHPELPWNWWNRFQAPATILAMSIGTAKWYLSDIAIFFSGQVGSQRFPTTADKWAVLIGFKTLWFLLHIVWPAYNWGIGFAFGSAFTFMVISSQYLENVFIVNHIQQDMVPPSEAHWAAKQVIGSANWSVGSHFWNWWSGGLNHQVEHHLFPSISQYCYPVIAPVVEQTCKEFGLPYNKFGNFYHAWSEMVLYLHRLGQPPSSPLHLNKDTVPSKNLGSNGKAASTKAKTH